jgi:ATP-dependent Lon protease
LNPEQRDAFVDRYLDLPFDLSGVLFIGSATDFRRIPRVLRDQFIEIGIAGYTPEEKAEIAFERLLPRLIEEHGLEPEDVEVDEEMLLDLTRGYARDAGIGSLRRVLSALLRFFAFNKTSGVAGPQSITPELMEEVLGSPCYQSTTAENAPEVGVVTGLAWTASGGELMFIEALKMAGTGRLIITGMLGDVMRESVNAAYSYVRSRAELLGISEGAFGDHDVHIHFPVGATPKEGPSAGAAVTLAIASSLAERPVRHDVAMTGEVTLRGKVLEIGGTKEKILAAYRAGLREVVLPAGNERDLREVPADVRAAIRFHFVERMEQIFDIALMPQPKKKRASNSRRQSSKSRSRTAAKGAT